MKKALITGITGFAGSFLAEHLLKTKRYEVVGTYLSEPSRTNVATFERKLRLFQIDLTHKEDVEHFISSERPDVIFHLAAFPSPAESFKDPSKFLMNNVIVELNVLEAVRKAWLTHCKILIVSSAEVYGLIDGKDLPVDENTPYRPLSPYAVSKMGQDFLGLSYVLSYDMDIVRVRPFNHVGPRLSPQFAPSAFAKRIAEIEKGELDKLTVGNLDAKRDYTDVRDMVVAYELAVEKGKKGDVYNIGSGKSYQMSDIVKKLISFSQKKITVEKDPALLRPSDNPELVCDNKKFVKATGWHPTIEFNKSLKDLLEYWRSEV